jgi:hypothetical protein
MLSADLKNAIDTELERAEQSRREGLEGRARVCARRAAGLVLKAYYQTHPIDSVPASAMDTLKFFRDDSHADPEAREIAGRLITRVNEDFQLPTQGDLIADARRLVQILEKDII